MITTANGFKVYNFKKVVSERAHVPYGFHVETWAVVDREDMSIVLYTSDYLSQNSWTTNHDDDEMLMEPCADTSEVSWSRQLRCLLDEVKA